jgi:transcription termination factor NusB
MKNLANFKIQIRTREYLVQAIYGELDKPVIIDESLRLSKKFSSPESYKFINANLDKYLKLN